MIRINKLLTCTMLALSILSIPKVSFAKDFQCRVEKVLPIKPKINENDRLQNIEFIASGKREIDGLYYYITPGHLNITTPNFIHNYSGYEYKVAGKKGFNSIGIRASEIDGKFFNTDVIETTVKQPYEYAISGIYKIIRKMSKDEYALIEAPQEQSFEISGFCKKID